MVSIISMIWPFSRLMMLVITHLAVLQHLSMSRDMVLHCWPVVRGRGVSVVIWGGERGPCMGCVLSWSLPAVSVTAVILSSETLDEIVCLDPVADTTLAVVLLVRCNKSAAGLPQSQPLCCCCTKCMHNDESQAKVLCTEGRMQEAAR